jgi:hypothetical protein
VNLRRFYALVSEIGKSGQIRSSGMVRTAVAACEAVAADGDNVVLITSQSRFFLVRGAFDEAGQRKIGDLN